MNGANTGTLTLRHNEVFEFLRLISHQDQDDFACAVRVNSSGLRVNHYVDEDASLISDEGEWTCLRSLRRTHKLDSDINVDNIPSL